MNSANRYTFHDTDIVVFDDDASITSVFIAKEIRENHYGVNHVKIKEGDVIIDIGANVGLWSIHMAQLHDHAVIYAIEGLDISFQNLSNNIRFNKITNITPVEAAITGTSGVISIAAPANRTAGASTLYGNKPLAHHNMVQSMKVDEIFTSLGIKHCALMKVNLEGGEYEAFFACTSWNKIGFLSIEVHECPNEAKDFDYTQDRLAEFIKTAMPKGNYHIVRVPYQFNPNPL